MNIIIKHGNIFDSRCDLLVNPVNCVGVMGAGLALQFKIQYPDMFKFYKNVCRNRVLKPGYPIIYHKQTSSLVRLQGIVLFPTKYDWREDSKSEYIESGLKRLIEVISETNLSLGNTKIDTSIAFPKLGCGLGKLDWNMVKEQMISILSNNDKVDTFGTIEIYE